MNAKQKRTLQVLRRLHEFLARAKPAMELGSLDAQVEALKQSIERLNAHMVEQDTRTRAWKSGTATRVRLARRLRLQYMRPVERMATAPVSGRCGTPA